MEDEYEIMPHHEIEKLKDEIGALRKSPSYKSGVTLQDSIENLSKQLKHMQNILEYASNDLNNSESSDPLIHKLSSLEKKMDTIMDQNEKVARSVLILVDLIREKELKNDDQSEDSSNKQENKQDNPDINPDINVKADSKMDSKFNKLNSQQQNDEIVPRKYSYQMPDAQFLDLNRDVRFNNQNAQNLINSQNNNPQSNSFNMQNLQRQEISSQQYSIPGPSSDFDSQSFNPQVQGLMQNNKQMSNFGSQSMQSRTMAQINGQSQNWNDLNGMNNLDIPPRPPGQMAQINLQNKSLPAPQKSPEKKGLFGFLTIK